MLATVGESVPRAGADVTGIDIAPTAIARARAKASGRGLAARFEVADALDPGRLSLTAGHRDR